MNLEEIREIIKQELLSNKEVLTIDELERYTGYKKGYIYKLTSCGSMPCSQPSGKKLFFERKVIDDWLLQRQNLHKIENTTRDNKRHCISMTI